ncbi:DUF2304 domain-containing protein [Ferdinandcohnia sp. Marseille-Q9671]
MSVQIISIVASILFIIQVMYFTSKNKLKDQQAFFWLIVASIGFLIAILLPAINRFASYIGVSYMPTLIYLFAFLVILSILLYQTTLLSDNQEKVKNIVQELAFQKKEIEEFKAELKNSDKTKNNYHQG